MKDKTIALLESRFAEHLADMVRKQGGVPISAPALAEVPEVDLPRIRALVEELARHPARLFVFQTGVGTRALFDATDNLGVTPALQHLLQRSLVAVRGPKPTAVLRGRQVRIDFSAAEPYTTRQLLDAVAALEIGGERVVVQRYGDSNVELEEALEQRGATVIEVPTYRWALPRDVTPLVNLIDRLGAVDVDAVVFTSASQVQNLFAVAQTEGRTAELKDGLRRTLVASIGPVCSRALEHYGVRPGLEANPPKLGPLVRALSQALGGETRPEA
ncbi:MAG TPA: uroporphyrinogen-III synthase [Burkholderiales bacterium]|jgi:uroporphyrinogen-III synthase|nr:uroporphyrinogen-III synthase [Burkholderiales bacterium]